MGFNNPKTKIILLFIVLISLISIPYLLSQIISFEPLSDRYALLIGISKYKENRLSLQYAHNDAQSLYNCLLSTCRFDKKNIKLLIDETATRENIRKNIEGWLYKNTKKDDKILIFFSGHGTQDIDNNNDEDDGYDEFLVPYDYDREDISSAIRDDIFACWINGLASDNIVLVFDCCYSGGAAKEKGFNHVTTRGEITVDSFIKDIFKTKNIGEIPKKGVALLGASQDNQVSYEEQEFGMGIFTYYFVDSLNTASDDDQDSILTIEEIFNSLKPKVLNYSKLKYNKQQEPIYINSLASQFKLAYLPPERKGQNTDKREVENILYQALHTEDKMRKTSLFKEVLEKDPINERVHNHLASDYFYEGMYEDALYHAEISLALSKSSWKYLDIAKIHDRLGSTQNAILYASKALELDKDDIDILNFLGNVYLKSQEYEFALNHFRKSLSLNDRQNASYIGLARLFIRQKDYDKAISILKKAQEINPDNISNIYLLTLLHKYGILKDKPKFLENISAVDGIGLTYWASIDLLIKQDSFREQFFKHAQREIGEFTILIEPYVYLMKYYSEYKKNKALAIGYFNDLVLLYPFLEDEKQIVSILK